MACPLSQVRYDVGSAATLAASGVQWPGILFNSLISYKVSFRKPVSPCYEKFLIPPLPRRGRGLG